MYKEYADKLARANGYNAGRWLAVPGMGFGDEARWWGDCGPRGEPHNGVDFREYEYATGGIVCLGAGSVVPVLREGEVVAVIKDFLGHSVFVSHGPAGGGGGGEVLLSACGHIMTAAGVEPGLLLRASDMLGRVSEYEDMPVPAHLHLSLLIVAEGTELSSLRWAGLETRGDVRFLRPK